MTHHQIVLFSIFLAVLIFLAAFFSAAETGLMAINLYRLRHKARLKVRSAILILRLLKRPDRLLGLILIGNCFSNIVASALATLLAVHFFGEKGVILSTVMLTLVILIFSEVAPKTVAALYPERISKWLSWPIFLLLKLFYPLVWLINAVSNSLLRLFHIKVTTRYAEPLSREELRSIVYETSGRLPQKYQNMLLGILDLTSITVNDVMVPQHQIIGIDLDQDWELIKELILNSTYDWLPVYHENINRIVGILFLRDLMPHILTHHTFSRESLLKIMREPYFIPEGTPLNIQLLNFQHELKRTALVVDEYGEIQGLLTLADILEEIVGEFSLDIANNTRGIQAQKDGSYLVDGSITLRDLKRMTKCALPTQGARTLNGLIIEYLESIPRAGTCIKINDYPIEIVLVQENLIKLARIFPRLKQDETHEEI